MAEFCPRCGNARTGAFRFCRSCAFDFDEAPLDQATPPPSAPRPPILQDPVAWPSYPPPDPVATPPTPPAATPAPPASGTSTRSRTVRGLIVLLIAGPIVIYGLNQVGGLGAVLDRLQLPQGSRAATLPPKGTVWFGETFDPATFEIEGKVTSGKVGDTLAFVGTLTKPGTGIQVRVMTGGVTTTIPSDDIPDGSEVAGGTLNLLFAGPMKVDFIDVGGNTLATGTLHVTA
jgi:hypothetical protein